MRSRRRSDDQTCIILTLFYQKMKEKGFWVSGGQDVCLIIAELEEIILV